MSINIFGSYAYSATLQAVHFGPGILSTKLPELLDELKIKRALVVTGKSLFTKTDVVQKVESVLKERGVHVGSFHEIGQHAPVAGINAAVRLLNETHADGIISVGGGSPIDAAKAMIYRHHEDGSSEGKYIRHIAIPTTLSAAEYTIGAGYSNEEGHKVGVNDPQIAPSGIILDAELTLATPERLWLSTGIRALDHAVENLYRPHIPYPVKVLCYAAIADLFKYLPLSKTNPEDTFVRQKLQLASWMSLWPVKMAYSSLGLSHSLGHKLGATYSIPHGITSCLTLAPVVALKASIASEDDKACLAQALSHLNTSSTGHVEQDVRLLSSKIQTLVDELGLKSSLTEYNVPEQDFERIAQGALGDPKSDHVPAVIQLLQRLKE